MSPRPGTQGALSWGGTEECVNAPDSSVPPEMHGAEEAAGEEMAEPDGRRVHRWDRGAGSLTPLEESAAGAERTWAGGGGGGSQVWQTRKVDENHQGNRSTSEKHNRPPPS